MWGLAAEVEGWGYALPTAEQMHEALFNNPSIEWNRIGGFQDVTLRLVAETLLPAPGKTKRGESPRSDRSDDTYVQGELTQQPTPLRAPRPGRFHLFCSAHNAGAIELAEELARERGLQVVTTQEESEIERCCLMLVYLNDCTWTSPQSDALAAHVSKAMDLGVPRLLAHEMPGLGQEGRGACLFDNFFSCERGTTPQPLLARGLYDVIAITLKGAPWRAASMVMLAQTIEAAAAAGTSEEEAPAASVERAGRGLGAGRRFACRGGGTVSRSCSPRVGSSRHRKRSPLASSRRWRVPTCGGRRRGCVREAAQTPTACVRGGRTWR